MGKNFRFNVDRGDKYEKEYSLVNEGVVLFLTGYNGSIQVQNNRFEKIAMRQNLNENYNDKSYDICDIAKKLTGFIEGNDIS